MFNGIQPRKYREVLSCLNATVREYPRGAHIVELGEQSHNTGVLLDGTIEEFLYDENGDHSPIPEQQLHAAGVRVELANAFIILHTRVLSALRHSYHSLSCFFVIRSRTFFDGSKGFVLFSKEYKKSEPFSYWKKVRILLLWCTSRDSNPGPTD